MIFYPIEDGQTLKAMRALLSPFLQTIRKCHDAKKHEVKSIFDVIVKTASNDVDPELLDRLNLLMNGSSQSELRKEHELLKKMNIRSTRKQSTV